MPKDMFNPISLVWILVGLLVGIIIMLIVSRLGLNKSRQEAELVRKKANDDAENTRRQAAIDGKNQAYELRLSAEKDLKEKKQEITDKENKLIRREDSLNFRDEKLTTKEKQLDDKLGLADKKAEELKAMEEKLQGKIDIQESELQRVASLSSEEAKKELFAIVEKKTENETTAYIRDKEEEAKAKAAETSRSIIAFAIQRYAQEETIERTVSVVALPNDDMKGRIIGREGRNIRTIEQATGVDLIIDDTPGAITISCFDPIRREIAKLTLDSLIKDGRIQPGRIEEVVNRMTKELNEEIQKIGEDAVFRLGIGKIDREVVTLIGRLRYRYSYGQNALEHSMEVANFAGMMAAELGLNQNLAKRAGLLHDIGKAVDFEVEGSHVELGAKIARKHGEDPVVINAIESHHGDKEPTSLISVLVAAADALSAARPGARYESMENYISRLEELEKIADSFEGIEKSYAIQAGREIRVMAVPEKLDDLGCARVAKEIKDKIESTMNYPGQIKVTVIREVRKTEIAK